MVEGRVGDSERCRQVKAHVDAGFVHRHGALRKRRARDELRVELRARVPNAACRGASRSLVENSDHTRTRKGRNKRGNRRRIRQRVTRESPHGGGEDAGPETSFEGGFRGRTWEMDHGAFSRETGTARRLPFCASVKSSRASCEPSRRRPRVHACAAP
ncbi:hypothetical protein X777_11444 [Ooceraea biroi]|uniref:Uncharacterized protein n=1 Tax=Ooceraea biroi TaxID=2015173 RepID=A0A026W2Z1_OOCBI|nr:hypothetical protein X777_11444 [Ooceraea biroi]